jgi:hypothetical protein
MPAGIEAAFRLEVRVQCDQDAVERAFLRSGREYGGRRTSGGLPDSGSGRCIDD